MSAHNIDGRGKFMRSQGKHVKEKNGSIVGFFATFLLVIAIMIALFIGGFVLWVFYGENGDGKADTSKQATPQETKEVKNVTVNVANDWSVPEKAFRGSNGYGKFVSKGVKNKIDLDVIYSSMGIDAKTNNDSEKKRIEAVRRFVEGLYYESDKEKDLSNGDTIKVYIRSTEDPDEIEEEAGITINGIGEHKNVTVSGLTEKFTYNELANRTDLLQALSETAEKKVRESHDGNHSKIFADEDRYQVELDLYGIYFAQPQDRSYDDDIVVIYRLKSTYPDSNYIYWNKDGDVVFTYEMCHFENINKDSTVDDIKKNLVYDAFRYQDKASEIWTWYKENLDENTTYYLQQMSYRG